MRAYTRFPRHSGWDDDDVGILQSPIQLLRTKVASYLRGEERGARLTHLTDTIYGRDGAGLYKYSIAYTTIGLYLWDSLNVAEISSHTRGPNDIVKGQLGDQWTLLEQQRHGLPNPPCSSKDRHLSMTLQRRVMRSCMYVWSIARALCYFCVSHLCRS